MSAPARTFTDALAAGDSEALGATLAPDVVMLGTRGGLDEERVIRGRQAVLDYFDEIAEPWETIEVEIEQIVQGDDAFVVFMREIGRSAHTGVEVSRATAVAARVADGAIVELRGYLDREEALAAAGLAERRG
jgi:ketosteroid isomerase-like protein